MIVASLTAHLRKLTVRFEKLNCQGWEAQIAVVIISTASCVGHEEGLHS